MSLDYQAHSLLYALEHKLKLPISFEAELRQALMPDGQLVYSLGMLSRIDAFLDQLRQSKPTEADFLAVKANANLLYVLAFVIGEVIARFKKSHIHWVKWAEFRTLDAANDAFGEGFHSSIAIADPVLFLPLVPIIGRLFDSRKEKSVAFSVQGILSLNGLNPDPLQAMGPKHFGIYVQHLMGTIPYDERQKIVMMQKPDWAMSDDLKYLFKHATKVFTEGRVVWGALVQANEGLFKPNTCNAPGEVIYDPQGLTPPSILKRLAGELYFLKANPPPENTPLKPYADHLQNEMTRLFHWPIPASLSALPLFASTTYFDCRLLPGGAIGCKVFPLLVHDAYPGAVLPLPAALWDPKQKAAWLQNLEGKSNHELLPELGKVQLEINRNQAVQPQKLKTPDTDFSGVASPHLQKPVEPEKKGLWARLFGK
jgi:hypothetical protein